MLAQQPIAETDAQLAADWPFVGVLERSDDVRGFVYVGNYTRPTRLSEACRRAGIPPWGDFRVTMEESLDDEGAVIEVAIPEPPRPVATESAAPPPPVAAPEPTGAVEALRSIVEQQAVTIERQEEQIVALRAARDTERASFLDEVEAWRRRYDGVVTDNARLKTEKHEAVEAAVGPMRAQIDALTKALGISQQGLAVVQAKEQSRAELGAFLPGYDDDEGDDAPPTAPPSPLDSLMPLVNAAMQLPAVQKMMGVVPPATPSGDGYAGAPVPPGATVQDAHVVEAAPDTAALDGSGEDLPEIQPLEPVPVDYAPALTEAALQALVLPDPTEKQDADWADGVAQWASRPEVRRDLSASTLLRVLVSLATEAALKQLPTARIAELSARLAGALGYAEDLRGYLSAGTPGVVVAMLKPLLRRAGVNLTPDAEGVLKTVVAALKKSLK